MLKAVFILLLCANSELVLAQLPTQVQSQALSQSQTQNLSQTQTQSEQSPQAEKFRSQIEAMRKDLSDSEEEQRAIMSSLFSINKKVKKLVTEHAKTDQKRRVLQDSAKELAVRILDLETRIKEQRLLLRGRLNAIYRFGGQGLARLVFSSMSSAVLERNLKILGIVAQKDLAIMKDYSVSMRELAAKQQTFLKQLASLKKTQRNVSLQQNMINKESILKANILEKIRRTKSTTLVKLRGLREKGRKIGLQESDEFLDLLLQPSFFEKKGSLAVPVQGSIQQHFGLWKDQQFNVTLNHKGLYFQAPAFSFVSAIFPGKVAYRGEIKGFGPTLILDHGDHYYSVYSGLIQMQVQSGALVTEGQKIASVSDGLYFEIRHFSEPSDPLGWMKGISQ